MAVRPPHDSLVAAFEAMARAGAQMLTEGRIVSGGSTLSMQAARLVEPRWRFARADLAAALRREGLSFRPFERWSEIATALLREDA